ncbi:MAG: DNA-processing protein DprA [Azovibrio sp.]|nr:DNA-processing protein DprA [Azovibrio sp.]
MPFATPDLAALRAWLRLTLIPGLGPRSQRRLLLACGSPEAVFAAPAATWQATIGAKAEALYAAATQSELEPAIEAALAWAAQPGQHILTLADPRYPAPLLEIADPPVLLYVRGDVGLLARPGIAVVGSRNASPQGSHTAEAFAAALSQAGLVIISGLALGIDAAAHRGALAAGGGTIAVIGTGADRLYPARNAELAAAILAQGAIVSEFPLGTPARAAHFPRRNRIIAGLAQGVLVVEAALESGSLITARLAGEQGREVFAIPGSIHSPLTRGCHRLIREGAKLVETVADVLEELPGATPAALVETDPPPCPPAEADSTVAQQVLAALGHDPCPLDVLSQRCGLTADALLAILMGLELDGHIAPLPGNRYQRLPPQARP